MDAKKRGLAKLEELQGKVSLEEAEEMKAELNLGQETHQIPLSVVSDEERIVNPFGLYAYNDFETLLNLESACKIVSLQKTLEELLEQDKQRKQDGLPGKVGIGKMVKPGKGSEGKVVIVPTTVEEKFVHDHTFQKNDKDETMGGAGDGEEGEVIGEQEIDWQQGDGEGDDGGEGSGGEHGIESKAYELGRILTERFQLPNIEERNKKSNLFRTEYELTDKNNGFGQFLDKKATLRKVVQTNIALGRLPDPGNIDSSQFIVAPGDKVYRTLSPERIYESKAMVFFLRDYSGSMSGKPTQLVVAQHLMIYSWLIYQYNQQVESRFILHDTEAKEVPDFYTYYNLRVGGGTQVSSGVQFINEIVEKENLAKDYNIYVFQGTDGDDWQTGGEQAISQFRKMMEYANRIGITVVNGRKNKSEVEKYLTASGLLKDKNHIRMDVIGENASDTQLIFSIRRLVSQDKSITG